MKVTELPSAAPTAKSAPAKSFAELLKPGASPKSAKPVPKTAQTRSEPPYATPAIKSAAIQRALPAGGKPTMLARGAGDARVKARAAATQSSRQHAASQRTEKTLAKAHAQAAHVSHEHHDDRAGDKVRAALFQAIERECGKQTSPREQEAQERPVQKLADGPGQAAIEASSSSPTTAASSSQQRAEAVAALVERIEVALKGSVPTMNLGLSDKSGAASVEIARTARGEVAVRIAAKAGKRDQLASAAGSIRSALEARGLRVKSLTVG